MYQSLFLFIAKMAHLLVSVNRYLMQQENSTQIEVPCVVFVNVCVLIVKDLFLDIKNDK